jgi:predicted Zn-dependent protease
VKNNLFLTSTLALSVIFSLTGCETLDQVTQSVTSVASSTGLINDDQAKSINKTTTAVAKPFEGITPSQEYYIGRTVGATILHKYKPYDQEEPVRYLNTLGQALALASERPETFGGYHFMILDTSEVNAFAAPGGLIFVSRGLILCCKTEDALAAVLAHEIGHVQLQHGLQAIEKGRITSAVTTLAAESGKNLGGQQIAELTKSFEGAITDITGTLVNNGYARKLEFQADASAVKTLRAIGYDPQSLVAMLEEMERRLKPGGVDFAKTHPQPKDRIAELRKIVRTPDIRPAPTKERAERFEKFVKKI